MVDCPRDDIRDLLPDLVHDQLEPAERARVEQHIVDCPECAAEVELLRTLRSTVFTTPAVDAARIAAAVVRAATVGTAPSSAGGKDVVPISSARERHRASDGESSPARITRPPARHGWRIAAGIAVVAAGVGGYALSRGGAPSYRQASESTAASVASAPLPTAESSTEPSAGAAAKAAAPASALAIQSATAGAADAASAEGSNHASSLLLGAAVNELSESDMQTLLQSMDDLEAMPDLEPRPLPVLARVVEGAL